jgi:putative tricarboxylic transport membrane protein
MNPIVLAVASLIVILGIGIGVRQSGKRQYLVNILIPCIMIAVSLIFLTRTFDFARQEEAGPELIPRLWIYLIVVLSGIILWQVFRGRDKVAPKIERPGLLVFVTVALIGYFAAMPYLGYFLSTFLFIVLLLNVLSYPKKVLIYVIAGGWCLVSYLVFYKLFYIQLPLGFFEDLFY